VPLSHSGSAARSLLLVALLATPLPALAVTPVLWTVETHEDFARGTPEGVAVSAAGDLVLAPALKQLEVPPLNEAPEPFLWSQVVDSKGTLYLGGGTGGHVYRVPKGVAGSLYYESGDLAVHALAIGPSDVLYAGTSPNGRILKITGEGKGELYYEPDDRYIWALLSNQKGEVFAATGEHGVIYKIPSKGKAEVFFDSDETHVVSLALDARGRLLAGTDGRGLLYSIGPDGQATVLHDSPLRELKSIAVDKTGVIYAAAVGVDGAKRPAGTQPTKQAETGASGMPAGAPVAPPMPLPGVGAGPTETVTVTASANGAPAPAPRELPKSEVYRIDRDNTVTTIWSSPDEVIYSLVVDPEGRVLVGSGEPGRIREISAAHRSSVLARVKESQVTSLVLGPGRRMYAASSNVGRAYVLDGASSESGTYLSTPRDARAVAHWGRISWRTSLPSGTSIEMTTRSGNSGQPDATWSDWSPAYQNPSGSPISGPPARFLQWRARLSRASGSASPALLSVSTSFVQSNLPPVVRSVSVNPPGVVRQRLPYLPETDPNDLAFTGIQVNPDAPPGADAAPVVPEKEIYVRGMRAITWAAEDPNHDRLSYHLAFRGEGESSWKPLARDLRQPYFAFDSMQIPDGLYQVRVEASDAPSNASDQARTDSLSSDPFTVDNTPPSVQVTARPAGKGSAVTIEVSASDGIGPIARAELSLDARRFQRLSPSDGISDSRSESYSLKIDAPGPGEHTVIVKVTDLLGNVGAGKAIFTTK
jgi:hypothetical protein